MVKTIQAALAPLLIIGAFCSLCVFEYPLGRPRPYFTCLYFLIVWSTYTYIACYLLIDIEDLFVIYWPSIIIVMSSYGSMVVSLFRFKDLKTFLRKLSIVDDTLEALGTPKEYQKLYKWMIAVIIVWIVSSNLLNGMDALVEDEDKFNIMSVCIALVENFLPHMGTINSVILGTVLGYMGSRFERVNKHIRNFLENDAEHIGAKNTSIFIVRKRVVETEECSRRVWIIMHVHLQLSRLSRELNKVFSVQLTLEMASLFAVLVEMFIEFYIMYADNDTDTMFLVLANLTIYVWIMVFTMKLLALNHICQTANETTMLLYKLSNNVINEDLREQVLQFIMQIKQREVKFSGMGLFYFGNNFIRKRFSKM
ncbi:uncharacterized protein LOC116849182 [Odontomachus brunneus]|uniref:uncharacterized protein LOC116849182 n=1 Tax=Odontomachus brunneus TaxID=486640 RepID=UPI0013F1944A|nr:uncharacterized protein LOC116849182 [Odontomachus brunneus]